MQTEKNEDDSDKSLDEKLKKIEDTHVHKVAKQIKKMNLNLSSIDQIDFDDGPKEEPA